VDRCAESDEAGAGFTVPAGAGDPDAVPEELEAGAEGAEGAGAVPEAEGVAGGLGAAAFEVETDAPVEVPAVAVALVVGAGGLALAELAPAEAEADAVGCELGGAETVADAEADGPAEVETDADAEAFGVVAAVGPCTVVDADPTGVETDTPTPSSAALGATPVPNTIAQAAPHAARLNTTRSLSRTAVLYPDKGAN
jgi:hypothetical protein